MNIRTWTQGGGVWLAEFESGADGVDSGEWGGGGASDAMDQWDGVDEDPNQGLDGIDDGGPSDLF